jgi:hypothetical protein
LAIEFALRVDGIYTITCSEQEPVDPLDKQFIPAQKVVMMITCTTTAATYFWAYL